MVSRLPLIKTLFLLFFFAVILRLGYWQIVQASDLSLQASLQHTGTHTIPYQRGKIFFSDGFPQVANELRFLMYVEPRHFQPTLSQARELATLLGSTASAQLIDQASTSRLAWFPLASKILPDTKAQIARLVIPGIGFDEQSARFYPEGSTSAALVGFVAQDTLGNPKGYFGLEGIYDRELKGRDGFRSQELDAQNQPIVIGAQTFIPPQDGRDLVTSIDRTIQFIAYQKLSEGIAKYQATSGTVTVMEPATGRILAMANLPNYDAANYSLYDPKLYKNPIITEGFEPGSTFKTVIMAAALDAGVVTAQTICTECSGPLTISDYPIRTWNNEYHPGSTMADVILNSDNVGMVFVSRQLGQKRMLNYIKLMGFGSETGIDLEEESSPSLRPDNQWYDIDYATASFGQGIAVTPMQLVRAVGAIANRGKLVTPRVVDTIVSKSYSKVPSNSESVQIISPQAAAQMTSMLVYSVTNNKVGWDYPREFSIAGKTGTAQIPIAGHYDATKTIGSFIGFAPADNPKFVMLVTLTETKTSPWGSRTAAPVWFAIAREILRFNRISPFSP